MGSYAQAAQSPQLSMTDYGSVIPTKYWHHTELSSSALLSCLYNLTDWSIAQQPILAISGFLQVQTAPNMSKLHVLDFLDKIRQNPDCFAFKGRWIEERDATLGTARLLKDLQFPSIYLSRSYLLSNDHFFKNLRCSEGNNVKVTSFNLMCHKCLLNTANHKQILPVCLTISDLTVNKTRHLSSLMLNMILISTSGN